MPNMPGVWRAPGAHATSGAGAPIALNVDGTTTPVIWSGGTAPGHTDTYLIVSFALIDKIPASPAGNEEYVVFGSAGAFS